MSFFETQTYLSTDVYFLCECFITAVCHSFYSLQQGFGNRDIIIGHANMYLVKTN